MMRWMIATLMGLGALVGLAESARADGHAWYYPYGWYVPKGSYWVRWHGLREPWTPPTPTAWTVVRPWQPGCGGCLPASPTVPFIPAPYLPPEPCEELWTYGKINGTKPVIRQLVPMTGPLAADAP
ncbi:MAG: hypothetical protein NZM31_00570 [Gemmatales bacterium]|nr:hypothetical protein [Gemmatales bacterium]MDW8385487.1 hypothetical protein [Gemmatales bacterium]